MVTSTAPSATQTATNTPTVQTQKTAADKPTTTPTRRATSTKWPTKTPTAAVQVRPKGNAIDPLNVRAGPGTNYDKIGLIEPGDEIEIWSRTGDGTWYKVRLPSGSFGWVAAEYIDTQAKAGAIAVIPASSIPPSPTVWVSPTARPTKEPVPP
ncbi:MAG: SH3 domain-containing protein, partial [Anaerolineae bacterium]|nr:SH3 domain-containing protein [Anaerolineae bacterium]